MDALNVTLLERLLTPFAMVSLPNPLTAALAAAHIACSAFWMRDLPIAPGTYTILSIQHDCRWRFEVLLPHYVLSDMIKATHAWSLRICCWLLGVS